MHGLACGLRQPFYLGVLGVSFYVSCRAMVARTISMRSPHRAKHWPTDQEAVPGFSRRKQQAEHRPPHPPHAVFWRLVSLTGRSGRHNALKTPCETAT